MVFFGETDNIAIVREDTVLILIVLDGILWVKALVELTKAQQVLILIVLDGILWALVMSLKSLV